MRRYAGVVRNTEDLLEACLQLEKLYQETESLYQNHRLTTALSELRNMVNVSYLIIQQSLSRKENRGGYYNEDYKED